MSTTSTSDRIVTVPNALSALRLLLVPLLAVLVVRGAMTQALTVFLVAAVTDLLDGLAARVLDQRTRLGSYLDPLADKSLALTSLVLLAWRGALPWWIAILAFGRDASFVAYYGLLRLRQRALSRVRPSLLGKAATSFELATIGMALIAALSAHPAWALALRDALCVGAALLIAGSAVQYVHHERRLIRDLVAPRRALAANGARADDG
ncbi:MAG: CDP-alcohol phosphatidyltransferase family protein [bacterium]